MQIEKSLNSQQIVVSFQNVKKSKVHRIYQIGYKMLFRLQMVNRLHAIAFNQIGLQLNVKLRNLTNPISIDVINLFLQLKKDPF